MPQNSSCPHAWPFPQPAACPHPYCCLGAVLCPALTVGTASEPTLPVPPGVLRSVSSCVLLEGWRLEKGLSKKLIYFPLILGRTVFDSLEFTDVNLNLSYKASSLWTKRRSCYVTKLWRINSTEDRFSRQNRLCIKINIKMMPTVHINNNKYGCYLSASSSLQMSMIIE